MKRLNDVFNFQLIGVKKQLSAVLFNIICYTTAIYGQANVDATMAKNVAGQASNTILTKGSSDSNGEIQKMLQYYDKQIYFTENKGQWPQHVLYKADFPLGQAIATSQGMMVGAFDPASIAAYNAVIMEEEKAKQSGLPHTPVKGVIKGHGWMMDFVNSSSSMSIESKDRHADVFNYVQGESTSLTAQQTVSAMNVSNYQEIWYKNVYNNVDVRYYPSEQGTLEYDIVCKPGFNKSNIALRFDGIEHIHINGGGHLALETSVGDMDFPAPVAYQQINGKRKSVLARYILAVNNELKFELGQYDASQPLIIDPIALRWATWITNNSTSLNHGHCIWVDPSDGSIYIAGKIGGTGLITVNAFQNAYAGGSGTDLEIGKYTEPDTIGGAGARVWQTYYGGTADDNPYAMQQGPDGNLYIVGYTASTNLPLSYGSAFTGGGASINDLSQTTDNIFVLKFNTAGNSYKASVIGGNGSDDPYDLRITKSGSIIVCGYTTSTNLSTLFPGSGASNTNNGGNDVLIFEINSDLSTISWMKNYGGSGNDQANIMLTDTATGDIFVAGQTASSNFPTTKPRQSSLVGAQDAFIQKLNSAGATTWSSYFNSASKQTSAILCMEFNTTESKIYFGGITTGLNSSNISSSGVYQKTYGGGTNDFFVALMDTAQNFSKGTYLGGSGNEVNMMGLNVDLNNDVYIFGYSNSTNFPVTSDALQSKLNTTGSGSNNDKTFTKLRTDLDSLDYSTYYGGTNDDYDPVGERGIKFSNCRIYTIVTSESNNIPLTQGAITTTRISGSSVYEPGLVVWANPPDLLGNTITGNQSVCAGGTPTGLTGSLPSYSLPNISRNSVITSYPVSYGSAATYEWQSSTDSINWTDIAGGTTQNLAGSAIGPIYKKTYFRRIIGGDACVLAGASGQTITITTLLVPATVTNAACFGVKDGSITANPYNGTSPYTYSWTGGATTQTLSNALAGTYSVIVTDAAGCKDTAAFTITQPVSAVSATKSIVAATCSNANGSAAVTAAGGVGPYTYSWNSGQISSSISNVIAGTYTVTIKDANNCSLSVLDTVVSVNTANASAGGNGIITCITGPQITLNGSSTTSGATFSWAATGGGNIVSGANTATPIVNAAGVYTLTVTQPSNGCSATSAATVTLNNTPPTINVSAGGPVTFCQGGSVTLNASGAVSYLWSNGATTSSIIASTGGIYTVIGTDAKSCTASGASTTVTVNSNPVVNISANGPTTFCNGNSVTLSATSGLSYIWSTGATTPSISVNSSGTYSVKGTDGNGCSTGSAGTSVLVNPNPQVSINPLTLCEGTSGNICATSSGSSLTYEWNSGLSDECMTVWVPGTYSVLVTDGNGCNGNSSVVVNVVSAPDLQVIKSGPVTFCQGDSVMLTAIGATNYSWNTGSTAASINVKANGLYTVTGNNAIGCDISLLVYVTVNPLPVVSISPVGSTTFCEGGSVKLNAFGAATYVWSNNDDGISIDVNSSGFYSVVGTDENGCTASAGTTITVNQTTPVSLGNFDPACLNAGVFDLNEGSPSGGIYSGPGISAGGFDPVAAGGIGSYAITYTYTNVNGCSSSAVGTLTVNDIPANPDVIDGPVSTTCRNTSASYSIAPVNGADSYTWSVPGGASIAGGQGTNSISVNFGNGFESGTVSVAANNDCGSTSPSNVVVNSVPPVATAILGNANPCDRGFNKYWVNPVPGASSYNWTVPAGSTILSGQGTDTVDVNIGNEGGYVSVVTANACGTGEAVASMLIDVSCRTMDPNAETARGSDLIMTVYPNPAHDMLNVLFNSNSEDNYSLKIFDMTGRIVMDQVKPAAIGVNLIKLDLHAASGLYIVSLTSGDLNKQTRIVIQ